jgi:hypothetical protein
MPIYRLQSNSCLITFKDADSESRRLSQEEFLEYIKNYKINFLYI